MTTDEKIDRLERAVGQLQRELREFCGWTPHQNLDLMNLPTCEHRWMLDKSVTVVGFVCVKCGQPKPIED